MSEIGAIVGIILGQYFILSKSKLVKFSVIESAVCFFTDSPVKNTYFTIELVTFH